MKKQDLISVIVPVYNVEKYLKKCVDSIINQTYKNIEIILVDDGSTDNSRNICEDYAKIDDRIRVVYKDNGGLSDARNIGIKNAKGKYVTLIDSDDYVENNYIFELYDQIIKNNVRMSVAQINIVNKKQKISKKLKKYENEVLLTEDCLKKLLLEDNFSVSANAKLYSKKLFKNITYPEGKLYEDNGTTYKLILECDKISVSNQSIYNYVIRNNSITNSLFSLKKLDYISLTDEACQNIVKKYPELDSFCQIRKAVVRMSILRQMLCSKMDSAGKCEYKKICKYLEDNYQSLKSNKYITKKLKLSLFLFFFNKQLFKIGATIYEKIK